MRYLAIFAIGILFGLGIITSGMANPAKVLDFFDIAGTWDPSLAFVMGGALAVTAIGYAVVLKRPAPLLTPRFHLPTKTELDARLLSGAAIFGVGWGIAGFCPGAALPALGTFRAEVFIFIAAVIAGMIAQRWLTVRLDRSDSATAMQALSAYKGTAR